MNTTNIAYFEHWPHPIAAELLPQHPNLNAITMQFDAPDASNWEVLEKAHVYQARSTRSELPEQFWPAAPLLARCQNLLAISTNGSGTDTVDLDACTAAGVLVVNQAGGNKQAVAEHAIGMMLCLSKRIIQVDRAMRRVILLSRCWEAAQQLFKPAPNHVRLALLRELQAAATPHQVDVPPPLRSVSPLEQHVVDFEQFLLSCAVF